MEINHLSEIYKALGHPVRLKIVIGLLKNDDCNVTKICENLKMPQSTISQHLAVLRNKGIISPVKHGVETCYHISDLRVKKMLEVEI